MGIPDRVCVQKLAVGSGARVPTAPAGVYALAIGSGAGDCAPAPSHTTGRAFGRIRRLNAAAFYVAAARSDGITNPWRRNTALLSPVCKLGLPAIRHAPRELCATFNRRPLSPN